MSSFSSLDFKVNAKQFKIYYKDLNGVFIEVISTNAAEFAPYDHQEVTYGVAGSNTAVRFSGVKTPYLAGTALYLGRMMKNQSNNSQEGFAEALEMNAEGEFPTVEWRVSITDNDGNIENHAFEGKFQGFVPRMTIEGGGALVDFRIEITSEITIS